MPFFARPIAKGIAAKATASFIQPQLDLHLDYLESQLGASGCSSATASPRPTSSSASRWNAASRAGLDNGKRPKLVDFLKRIHARPAYQRALEQGGPYVYA